MSPGRRSRGRGGGAKSPAVNAAAVAEAFAAEFGLDDSDGDSLKPFGPIPLEEARIVAISWQNHVFFYTNAWLTDMV